MPHAKATTDLPHEPSKSFEQYLIDEHHDRVLPRLERLWDYYRNDLTDQVRTEAASGRRPYRLAQERGLPQRLTARRSGGSFQREIVVENDIAWRIHALVDFMFGKPFALQSLAPMPDRASLIETFLTQVLDANGGIGFFQDVALLGAVYGYADVLLRVDQVPRPAHHHPAAADHQHSPASDHTPNHQGGGPGPAKHGPMRMSLPTYRGGTTGAAAPLHPMAQQLFRTAPRFVLEIIEAPRAIPVLNPADYRRIDAYLIHYRRVLNRVESVGLFDRLRDRVLGRSLRQDRRATVECTELWTANESRHLEGPIGDRRLINKSLNRLGRIPLVHIQNLPQPFFYEGLSEVEPLIPLQDELNTRLSDRANRVTFQSFKMYLGKGIDKFLDRPVGPGQMWATENPEASIEEFGGDAASPSEDEHIREIREAMDKASAVTPIAAGVLRDKIGNLTSENALRVTLMGTLSRTDKKRITYGQGIERLCELILHAADVLGVLPNAPEERRVRIDWPSPLPESESARLRDAKVKLDIGVPARQVLAELGYTDDDAA